MKFNIEQPKNCKECRFSFNYIHHNYCLVNGFSSDENLKGRPKHCPGRKENQDVSITSENCVDILERIIGGFDFL